MQSSDWFRCFFCYSWHSEPCSLISNTSSFRDLKRLLIKKLLTAKRNPRGAYTEERFPKYSYILTLLLGNVLWNGSIEKGSDFEGEDDKPTIKALQVTSGKNIWAFTLFWQLLFWRLGGRTSSACHDSLLALKPRFQDKMRFGSAHAYPSEKARGVKYKRRYWQVKCSTQARHISSIWRGAGIDITRPTADLSFQHPQRRSSPESNDDWKLKAMQWCDGQSFSKHN